MNIAQAIADVGVFVCCLSAAVFVLLKAWRLVTS